METCLVFLCPSTFLVLENIAVDFSHAKSNAGERIRCIYVPHVWSRRSYVQHFAKTYFILYPTFTLILAICLVSLDFPFFLLSLCLCSFLSVMFCLVASMFFCSFLLTNIETRKEKPGQPTVQYITISQSLTGEDIDLFSLSLSLYIISCCEHAFKKKYKSLEKNVTFFHDKKNLTGQNSQRGTFMFAYVPQGREREKSSSVIWYVFVVFFLSMPEWKKLYNR